MGSSFVNFFSSSYFSIIFDRVIEYKLSSVFFFCFIDFVKHKVVHKHTELFNHLKVATISIFISMVHVCQLQVFIEHLMHKLFFTI